MELGSLLSYSSTSRGGFPSLIMWVEFGIRSHYSLEVSLFSLAELTFSSD
uniref:Uncharacterized protein n=1 Tax=Rhizophora mucronata TaxID=61149 RepID=A0A2P2Q1V1_RHIMU